MKTKLQTLKDAAARQNWKGALRIAAKFSDLGEHKAAIVRGHEAHNNARFARQLGRDPAADIEAGIAALCARYSLNRDGTESTAPKVYTLKSNARRAMKAQGLNASDVMLIEVEGGWTWVTHPAAMRSLAEDGLVSDGDTDLSAPAPAPEPVIEAPAPVAEAPKAPAGRPARVSSEAVQAKRRAMLTAADAKGFAARWNAALEAARAGELPAAPDFSKPTHSSGRKWLAEAVTLRAAGDIEGLRGLVYDPEGSTGAMLHRFVRFSILGLEARAGVKAAA